MKLPVLLGAHAALAAAAPGTGHSEASSLDSTLRAATLKTISGGPLWTGAASAPVQLGVEGPRQGRRGVAPPRPVGRGRTYKIPARDRGYRIGCFVDATNDGGYVLLAAANRLVAR